MDILGILSTIVGAVVAIALAYLGFMEWSKASKEEKIAIVERVVLAVEQMHPDLMGGEKLTRVMDRIESILHISDVMEVRELVEATVARINLAKKAGAGPAALGRGYWSE